MTARQPMVPLRRRPIPGMTGSRPSATTGTGGEDTPAAGDVTVPSRAETPDGTPITQTAEAARRRPSADYGATRLVNFRLPVDLHDRYRRLVREIEDRHPRLRRPSLTEAIIGLLEEGPADVDELAAVIRRKRCSETAEDAVR